MVFSFFAKRAAPLVQKLYLCVIAASRRTPFYLSMGVPDTTQGRFEMAVFHSCLMLRQLRKYPELTPLGQDFVDLLFRELDSALRELGISDLSVPKRMKKLASAVYGRFGAYDEAFSAGSLEEMRQALLRNLTLQGEGGDGRALAEYALAADRYLEAHVTKAGLSAGEVDFPPPIAA